MPSESSSPAPCHVGVVFGGASGEHAVSIRSAATVVGALRSGANASRYRLSGYYIDSHGRWWGPELAEAVLAQGTPASSGQLEEAARRAGLSLERRGFCGFPEGALEVELWFPVLHGPNGEDGTIQGLFSLMQVPFVGSGAGSGVCPTSRAEPGQAHSAPVDSAQPAAVRAVAGVRAGATRAGA